MSDLPKSYNPADYEQKLYSMWEQLGAFSPDSMLKMRKLSKSRSKSGRLSNFCIIMPPPNANGELHIGHAVFVTLEDLMIRYHRMQGHSTLWLPGADHAGFETQVVFERKLEKEGKTRFQFNHDELYQMMWEFTQTNKKTMESQLRRLGASCDWSRNKFTLDSEIVDIVYATFKNLYDDGLAYRDLGIVSWCTKHQTSLSDLEVKYVEQTDPLYYLKYGPFTIATARPETKFGDKYVVVHPKDKRYRKYKHGEQFKVNWLAGNITATLIKDETIDPSFGSGAMTITPWHDAADFAIAKRHNLKIEQIIGQDGRLLKIAGKFAGMKIKPARQELVKFMKQKGLIEKIQENYQHNVAVCYKCGSAIEPQVLTQWFLAMSRQVKSGKLKGKSLQKMGLEAVNKKQVIFVTKRFKKIYNHWLENIHDWNVSRQIAWGIPINGWYCQDCQHTQVEIPQTIELLAIRHGEDEHNVKKVISGDPKKAYDFTQKGIEQAKRLAWRLKAEKLDAIYASQFLRTQKTAKAIARYHRLKIVIDSRLNDIYSGGLEGESVVKARRLTNRWLKSVEGSETLKDIENRAVNFVTEIAKKHRGKKVAIVSSEIVLHILERLIEGHKPTEYSDDHPRLGTFERLRITTPIACEKCGGTLKRDTDVFDTWFSSGQWPFATLLAQSGSNSKVKTQKSKLLKEIDITEDFRYFYPTTVMETGHDILFFWVARMIMLGMYVTGEVPFKYVYLHGLVRDKDRQKMSKSKGNVIDPLGVASLYGTDAVRMALVFGVAGGNDIVISEEKIRGMRNFANKIWNIARFILMNRELKSQSSKLKVEPKTKTEQKLFRELDRVVKDITQNIEKFRFHQAAERLYNFIWHRFADIYIEESKKGLITPQFLLFSFKILVKLLQPFMPFVSEAIWQELRANKLVKEQMLITASWPR